MFRKNLIFENGYGRPFGVKDEEIKTKCCRVAKRDELFERCDLMLLPKPGIRDFELMKENSVLWGWPHCVQQEEITRIAIEKRLTLIAF